MTAQIGQHAGNAVLLGSLLWLSLGTLGYHLGRERLGRVGSILGFGLLAVLLAVLTGTYATGGRSDRLVILLVVAGGLGVTLQAIRLTVAGWPRRDQLATITATILLVVLPFELYPQLQTILQETLTAQLLTISDGLGHQPTLEPTADGQLTRLAFENGGHIRITRQCTGIDGVALFTGLLAGMRTTRVRKLAGFVFMLVAVYVVNMFKMVFVVASVSGDWFGPLLTGGNTVQTTYYVAEVAIGQPLVVFASVAGYLWVSRLIPDGIDFAVALLDTFDHRHSG